MSGNEILTKDDLELFRQLILSDIKELLKSFTKGGKETLEGYKSKDVRKILGCSANKLVSLRIAGKLKSKKIGGSHYYKKEDIQQLVNGGF